MKYHVGDVKLSSLQNGWYAQVVFVPDSDNPKSAHTVVCITGMYRIQVWEVEKGLARSVQNSLYQIPHNGFDVIRILAKDKAIDEVFFNALTANKLLPAIRSLQVMLADMENVLGSVSGDIQASSSLAPIYPA